MKNGATIVLMFCIQTIGAADFKNKSELVSNKYFYKKVTLINVTDKTVAAQLTNTFTLANIIDTSEQVSEWIEIPTFQNQNFFFTTYTRKYKNGHVEKKELKHHTIAIKTEDEFLDFITVKPLDDKIFFITSPSKGTLGHTVIKRPVVWCDVRRDFCLTENYFSIVYIKNECAQTAWIYPEVTYDITYSKVAKIYHEKEIDPFKVEHGETKEFGYHSYSESFAKKKDYGIVNIPPTHASVICLVKLVKDDEVILHLLRKAVSPVICGLFMHVYYYSLRYTPEKALDLVEATSEYACVNTTGSKGVSSQ